MPTGTSSESVRRVERRAGLGTERAPGQSRWGGLAAADLVLTSDLTSLECERALVRLSTVEKREVREISTFRVRLNRVLMYWIRLALYEEVLERAKLPFPGKPARSLDALHLASALSLRSALPDLLVLSLDQRVRENAALLGFAVLPNDEDLV